MEEQLARVKRGDRVLVEDTSVYDGCVVVVIGVTAVIRVARNDGAGDMYRAAETRCCKPRFDEMAMGGRRAPEQPAARPGSPLSRADRVNT